MPQRPRKHVLEDESLLVFQQALPPNWIFRRGEKDYGIDGSVELVDRTDVTGQFFFIQLKATDAKDLRAALRVRLTRRAFDYYQKLAVPVLIVRYHSPTRALYCRWSYDFDASFAKKAAKSLSFTLAESDRWNSESPKEIRAAFSNWRWIKAPTLAGEVPLRLRLGRGGVWGCSPAEIIQAINARTRHISDVLRIDELGVNARGEISVQNTDVVVRLPAGNTCTLHGSDQLRRTPDAAASDIILAVSVALDRSDHSTVAAVIALSGLSSAEATLNPSFLISVARPLLRSGKHVDVLDAAIALAERGMPPEDLADLIGEVAVSTFSPDRGWQVVADRLEELVDRLALRYKTSPVIGTMNYNVGHFIGYRLGDHLRAFNRLRRTRQLDPAYRLRAHFWRDLGSSAFELGRFHWARLAYERALVLGDRNEVRGRLGDVLLRLGKYDEAREAFRTYARSRGDKRIWWLLGEQVAATIATTIGAGAQLRARARVDTLINSEGDGASITDIINLLRADAILPHAWFNLGLVHARSGDWLSAFDSFVVAAFLNVHDVEAWGNAVLSSLNLKSDRQPRVVPLVVFAAASQHGAELYRFLVEHIRKNTAASASDLEGRLHALLARIPPRDAERVLRLLHEDGTVTELDMKQPDIQSAWDARIVYRGRG